MSAALSIIIVSCNTREDLLGCLTSLADHPPSCAHEVVVVDNASTDGSVEAVNAAFPGVRTLALATNAGFAAANNAGVRATTAPWVLLLNSDTLVTAGALDTLRARAVETGATAAGPRLVNGAGRVEISFGSMLSPITELRQRLRQRAAVSSNALARGYVTRLVGAERVVDWVSGACLLVRRDAAEAAGLLDERFFLYEEDVDFCAALRAGGGRVLFTPRAEIVHLRGRSRRAAGARADAEYDRSHVLFYQKHAPQWLPLLKWWKRVRGRGSHPLQ